MAHSPDDSPVVPAIVTTDLSSKPNIVLSDDADNATDHPHRSLSPPPSGAGLLSPASPSGRASLEVPMSPSSAASDDGTLTSPPSPTLSNRSDGPFSTSIALRDNKPDASSGMSSLHLLSPDAHHQHRRKGSIASDMTQQDAPSDDAHNLRHVKSNTTSFTHVDEERARHEAESKQRDAKHSTDTGQPGEGDEEEGAEGKGTRAALEQDENLDPAPFAFRPFSLARMLDPKSITALEDIGGVEGLTKGLGTSEARGLSDSSGGHKPPPGSNPPTPGGAPPSGATDPFNATIEDRQRVYGPNTIPARASKTLLQLMWIALKDKVLVLLSIAAVISLALGLFQDFGPSHDPDDPQVDWVEGVAIVVAIIIVVMVGSLNDWQKERQFKTLNEKKEERGVKVIRDGVEKVIDIKQVVVGDIALLEPGEVVPCDGIFLSGHNVKCDESGATGESDAIRKLPYADCIALRDKYLEEKSSQGIAVDRDEIPGHTDCFVVSGSKVLEGVGKYVVVAVGQKSFNGRIMMALRSDGENTPLQLKLNNLAELIAYIGGGAGLLLFVALLIRFFVQLGTGEPVRTASEKGIAFVNILVISVTLVVVAVPEGLPLAVTLALAFATKRMTYENLLVRVLGSCETMANASVVCTDKTGTLTQNEMTIVAGSLGVKAKFVRSLEENKARTNAADSEAAPEDKLSKQSGDFSLDLSELNNILPESLKTRLNEAVAINSTAFEDTDAETGITTFVGSKTETALLKWAKELGWGDFRAVRDGADVVQMIPFSSERKAMGVVVRTKEGRYRVYMKGASEILSKRCSSHVVVSKDGASSSTADVETQPIDQAAADNISRTIIFYANQTLRTIALCYRDFEQWPPAGAEVDDEGEVAYDVLAKDMVLLGVVGIEDPLRDGVRDAVAKCQRAGVAVKMCTGDNVLTARSIALQCGIFTPGGIIMEGPTFRELSKEDMLEIVPRLQVLARSSPEDKKILVNSLKSLGEIVGVTGDGTNDGPALKTANVGFSMGIAGTEVAKEASDIILMDDNFASIVKAIMWGRCVNDAVRKFLQFQISTNVTAVIITFVSAVASDEEESVLSAVQLLWINIIMDTFAALALATDPASESLLDRKPEKKSAPLFSVHMYKQILFQSVYQVTVILIFHFIGLRILGFEKSENNDLKVQTLVFNAFVFAQIFNSINCRRLDDKLNIFEGVLRNWYFICITLLEICIQIVIVFVGGAAFQVTRISGREWGISLALGVVSIPLGALIRLLPTPPFQWLFQKVGLFGKREVLPTTSPEAEEDKWAGAVSLVHDNLGAFANIRGGRVRSSSFVIKSRSAKLNKDKHGDAAVPPVTWSSMLTMAPTLMAGAVVAGQGWKQRGSLSDPASTDPSRSSAALWEGKIQLHPDTDPEDPVYKRFGGGGRNTV
ncbi:hypothetical protein GGF50DRAFT_103433 [Schizophyllum commune]